MSRADELRVIADEIGRIHVTNVTPEHLARWHEVLTRTEAAQEDAT